MAEEGVERQPDFSQQGADDKDDTGQAEMATSTSSMPVSYCSGFYKLALIQRAVRVLLGSASVS